jgi:hypothetical protein
VPRWALPIAALLLLAALAAWLLAGPRVGGAGDDPSAEASAAVDPDAGASVAGAPGGSDEGAPTAGTGAAARGAAPENPAGAVVSDESAAKSPPAPKTPEPPPANEEWLRLPDRPIPETAGGTVSDRVTGVPLPAARILLAVGRRDSGLFASWGEAADDAGRFSMRPRDLIGPTGASPAEREAGLRTMRGELRIRVPGYETWRGPAEDVVDARLDPLPGPVAPGVVEGVVTTADGKPYEGAMAVEGIDRDFGDYMCQWTTAEPGGRFRIEGVPAGPWRLGVPGSPSGARVVEVPSGGTVAVDLSFEKHYAGPGEEGGRLSSTRRPVVVTDLPSGTGPECAVRAELRARHFFRVSVRGDRAEFQSLPVGNWIFVLQRGGFPEVSFPAEVPEGEGPFTLRWKGP